MANHDYLIVAGMIAATVAMALWPGRGDRPAPQHHSACDDPAVLYGGCNDETMSSKYHPSFCDEWMVIFKDGTPCEKPKPKAPEPPAAALPDGVYMHYLTFEGGGWVDHTIMCVGGGSCSTSATCGNGGAPCAGPSGSVQDGCWTGGAASHPYTNQTPPSSRQILGGTATCSAGTSGQLSGSGTWTMQPGNTANTTPSFPTIPTGSNRDNSALEKKIDELSAEVRRLQGAVAPSVPMMLGVAGNVSGAFMMPSMVTGGGYMIAPQTYPTRAMGVTQSGW